MSAQTRYSYYGGRGTESYKNPYSRSRFGGEYRRKLYRSRSGIIFGVCRGVADFFGFSVFWIRLITLVLFLFTGFWPTAVLYIVAALVMKPEPIIISVNASEQSFRDDRMYSREMAADRVKKRCDNLARRIQRLEHTVTTPEYDWERRLNNNT